MSYLNNYLDQGEIDRFPEDIVLDEEDKFHIKIKELVNKFDPLEIISIRNLTEILLGFVEPSLVLRILEEIEETERCPETGGHIWKNISRIEARSTISDIRDILDKIFPAGKPVTLVSSGGHKWAGGPETFESIGDLDFLIDNSHYYGEIETGQDILNIIYDILDNSKLIDGVRVNNKDIIYTRIPLGDKNYQVDFFLTDNFEWSYKYFNCTGKYSSYYRNTLISHWFNWKARISGKNRIKTYFGYDGLYTMVQKLYSNSGNRLKKPISLHKVPVEMKWGNLTSHLPVEIHHLSSFESLWFELKPHVNETFWENLIGKFEKTGHKVPVELMDFYNDDTETTSSAS